MDSAACRYGDCDFCDVRVCNHMCHAPGMEEEAVLIAEWLINRMAEDGNQDSIDMMSWGAQDKSLITAVFLQYRRFLGDPFSPHLEEFVSTIAGYAGETDWVTRAHELYEDRQTSSAIRWLFSSTPAQATFDQLNISRVMREARSGN